MKFYSYFDGKHSFHKYFWAGGGGGGGGGGGQITSSFTCSLHHETYAPAKFAVATSNSLGGDAFTRKYIILTRDLGLNLI